MLQSEVRAASLAACLDDVGAAVLQALTVGASDVSVTASVTSAITAFRDRQLPLPDLSPHEEQEPVYDECPDGLIDLPSASEQFAINAQLLRMWIRRGHIKSYGRLKGAAKGGGIHLLNPAEITHRLNSRDKKGGRPKKKV